MKKISHLIIGVLAIGAWLTPCSSFAAFEHDYFPNPEVTNKIIRVYEDETDVPVPSLEITLFDSHLNVTIKGMTFTYRDELVHASLKMHENIILIEFPHMAYPIAPTLREEDNIDNINKGEESDEIIDPSLKTSYFVQDWIAEMEKIPAGTYDICFECDNDYRRIEYRFVARNIEIKKNKTLNISFDSIESPSLLNTDYIWVYTHTSAPSDSGSLTYEKLGDMVTDPETGKKYFEVLYSETSTFENPLCVALLRQDRNGVYCKPQDVVLPDSYWKFNGEPINPIKTCGNKEFLIASNDDRGNASTFFLKNPYTGVSEKILFGTIYNPLTYGYWYYGGYDRFGGNNKSYDWIPEIGYVGEGAHRLAYPLLALRRRELLKEDATNLLMVKRISNDEIIFKNPNIYEDYVAGLENISDREEPVIINNEQIILNSEISSWKIFSVNGTCFASGEKSDNNIINTSSLPEGVYILLISTPGSQKSFKFIRNN